MASPSLEGLMNFNLQCPVDEKQDNWGDYLCGAILVLQQDFHIEKGIRGIVKGSIPIGNFSSLLALLCDFGALGNLAHCLAATSTIQAWLVWAGRFDIGSLDSYEEVQKRFG